MQVATVTVKQKLSTHEQMDLLSKFSEGGIRVTAFQNGSAKEIGKIVELYPVGDTFKAKIETDKTFSLKGKDLNGFTFNSQYGITTLVKVFPPKA